MQFSKALVPSCRTEFNRLCCCLLTCSAIMRDWSQLPVELLSSIFDCLSFKDQCRAQAVCSPWNAAGKICSKIYSNIPKDSLRDGTPWLMLPLATKPTYQIEDTSCLIFNLKEKRMYHLTALLEELGDTYCVGSSHGWLVLLDLNANVFLFNPFTNSRIHLPSVDILADRCACDSIPDGYESVYIPKGTPMPASHVRKIIFSKAILCVDEDTGEFYAVAVIHSEGRRVAYCRRGDDRWIDLGITRNSNPYYFDIVYKNNELYVVSPEEPFDVVEVWDIHGYVPVRTVAVGEVRFEDEARAVDEEWDHIRKYYAIKSEDDLLTILRFQEAINLDNEDNEDDVPLDHLKTTNFLVFKLDFEAGLWRQVQSLGERALFVGQNQSLSVVAGQVNGLQQNSIYFTDDCWDPYDLRPPSYHVGDDVGVFNMENGSIQHIYQSKISMELPQHFWIVPSLSNF